MEAAASPPLWFYIIVSTASVLTIVAIIWAIVGWFTTVKSTIENLKGFGEWKGAVDTDRETFRDFIIEIRTDIRDINENIRKLFAGSSSN